MPYPRRPANEEDPELVAEREVEKLNGLAIGKPKNSNGVVHTVEVVPEKSEDAKSIGKLSFKEAKASRKKRCRGISGSSIKKDGGKFDMGMENYDNFDDVSDVDEADNYDHYAKYVSQNYSSSNSQGVDTDSESGSLSLTTKAATNSQVTAVIDALLSSTDDGPKAVASVAQHLMEEYDETGRTRILEKALIDITNDAFNSQMVNNIVAEAKIVRTISSLLEEGLLNRTNFSAYVDNARSYTQAIALMVAALKAENGQPEMEVPSEVDSLASQLSNGGDVCDIATALSKLAVPQFHSQFVYKVCEKAVNSMNMDTIFFVTGALREMLNHDTLSTSAVRIGFARFFQLIPDLEIDLPGATSLSVLLVSYAANDHKLITEDLYTLCPKPTRFLVKKSPNCGKLTVLDEKKDKECNENNYFIMED